MYEHILVPTDGSDVSELAATEAFTLARKFGSTVHLLFVVDESASTFLLSTDTMADVLAELEDEGVRATDELAELADGVDVVTSVVRGISIQKEIVEYVSAHDIDLVVMGTHGRHGVEHLLGSTTERVLTNTHVPVLVVGHKDA